jgi:hypothetical protein
MGNKRKKKEPTTDETNKEPEIYSENISKIAESFKVHPKIALDAFAGVITSTLHVLGVNKYVTIEFNPDAYDKPLHTFIMVSKPLEEEWGKDKVNEFIKEFYNYAMERFAYTMNLPRGDVLDAEAEAVQLSAIELSGGYGFDAIIELYFNPTATGIDAYRVMWILVKK